MLKNISVDALEGLINYNCDNLIQYNSIIIDSRIVKKGDVFVGLKGARVDGNEYACEALKNGASFVILDNEDVYKKLNNKKILVSDSFKTLKSIGAFNLKKFGGLTIAITGSAGKTSTKELIYTILTEKYSVYKSFKNNNNALGLALNCANLDLDSDIAVFECGTNAKGEIFELANYILPEISVITNIGHSHIGKFGSQEAIAEEKLSIIAPSSVHELWISTSDYIKYGHLIDKRINIKTFSHDYDERAKIFLNNMEYKNNRLYFNVAYNNRLYQFVLNHFFKHFVYDALPAIGLAFEQGLTEELINTGLSKFNPLTGRGHVKSLGNITVVDDTYNASYDSIISSIDSLNELSGRKIAILGTMAEIEGYEDILYNKLYDYLLKNDNIIYILIGGEYQRFAEKEHIKIVENKTQAVLFMQSLLKRSNDSYTILVKGARKNALEELVELITNPGVLQSVI